MAKTQAEHKGCKHCGAPIDRGKWCSDRCRMANKRRPEPEHEQGEQSKANKRDAQSVTEPKSTGVCQPCQLCGAPAQLGSAHCLKCCTGTPAPKVVLKPEKVWKGERSSPKQTDPPRSVETDRESSESMATPAIGPLSVYSPARWAFLQNRGHVWDADRQRSYRSCVPGVQPCKRAFNPSVVMGVPVPGDPAYQGAT